jgi:hypothetical protein
LGNRLGPEIIKNVEQPSKGFSGAGWKACAANKISNASKRISSLQKPNRRLLRENGKWCGENGDRHYFSILSLTG